METIVTIITSIITFILGVIAKKIKWFNNYLIPVQNIIIGIVITTVYYIYTKDISYSVLCAGLFSGGLYDLLNNLKKMFLVYDEEEKSDG